MVGVENVLVTGLTNTGILASVRDGAARCGFILELFCPAESLKRPVKTVYDWMLK